MQDLGVPLGNRLRSLIKDGYSSDASFAALVNSVIEDSSEIEQIISFLEDAPSFRHQEFAEEMRKAFENVLRQKLEQVLEETQGDAIGLYRVLLDIYNIDACPEVLQGIITINYDEFMEEAIQEVSACQADFGVRVSSSSQQDKGVRLLKLHGSFGWRNTLPISRGQSEDDTLWIPPGIHKSKQAYPFNALWGLASEMLACDVLRVVGCRLGPNDWDLISLLFTMSHVNEDSQPQIEVIDAPFRVNELNKAYPYLEFLSILEIERVGRMLITEFTGQEPRNFSDFTEDERQQIIRVAGRDRNWFELWLTAKIESLAEDLDTMSTRLGLVEKFLYA